MRKKPYRACVEHDTAAKREYDQFNDDKDRDLTRIINKRANLDQLMLFLYLEDK